MAQTTVDSAGRPTVFLRNATGPVKTWSAYDAFIYSFMSVNLVTLGLYGMSFAYSIPDGHLLPAIIFTGIAVSLLVIVYAALITAIPRAGGDYTWQSRILVGVAAGSEQRAASRLRAVWKSLWVLAKRIAHGSGCHRADGQTMAGSSITQPTACTGTALPARRVRLPRDSGVALPGAAGLLAGRQSCGPVRPDPGDGALVLRLGRHPVPLIDQGHLRGRLRPRAACVGGQHLGQPPSTLRSPGADDRPLACDQRSVRLKPGFSTYTLDATLVIAVTYLGTIIAATILPWCRRDIFASSPIAQYRLVGVPLITITGLLTSAFLICNLVKWATDSVYGVNNSQSAVYMLVVYALAIVIYAVARVVRSHQGIDLARIHAEIPVG